MSYKKGRTLKVVIDENRTVISDVQGYRQKSVLEETDESDEENRKRCGCTLNKFHSIYKNDETQLHKPSDVESVIDSADAGRVIIDPDVPQRKLVVKSGPAIETILKTNIDSKRIETVIIITDDDHELTDEFFDSNPFDAIVEKIREIKVKNDVSHLLYKMVQKIEDNKHREELRKKQNLYDINVILQEMLLRIVDDEQEELFLESTETIKLEDLQHLSSEIFNFPTSSSTELNVYDLTSGDSLLFIDQRMADIMNTEDCYCTDFFVHKSPTSFKSDTDFEISTGSELEEQFEDAEQENVRSQYLFSEPDTFKNKAEQYFEQHKIKQFFHYLCSQLLSHTPENPICFLIKLVDKCLLYRETRVSPPLLFDTKHIESLFNRMDMMGLEKITTEQYKTGMFTLGLTNYNQIPIKYNQAYVSKEFFVREATRLMINNLDAIIKDHDQKSYFVSSSSGVSRNGSTVRPNTRN